MLSSVRNQAVIATEIRGFRDRLRGLAMGFHRRRAQNVRRYRIPPDGEGTEDQPLTGVCSTFFRYAARVRYPALARRNGNSTSGPIGQA